MCNMRKNVLIIFALIMLSACHNRQTQSESSGAAVADSTEVMAPEETDLMASHPQNYRLTGTIGEDKASSMLALSSPLVKTKPAWYWIRTARRDGCRHAM